MSKRIKPSGAEFKKMRIKRQKVTNHLKAFMENYMKGSQSQSVERDGNHASVSGFGENITDKNSEVLITT